MESYVTRSTARSAKALEVDLLASVIIATYNRCDALIETLQRLADQTIAPCRYEIVVVDDGSRDGTFQRLKELSLPCALRALRHSRNRGVSAARNAALREARGQYLILVSDDLLVSRDFIAGHVAVLQQYPRSWVVGGFEQLPSLSECPFGRYLDRLERRFTDARKTLEIAPNLWELSWPTARNLSLPRVDYLRVGPFDEQFRTTCEDQDWAERARAFGIRFLYDEAIRCLHNDQVNDLRRYCRFQMKGASDTVRFCAKYPERHGSAPLALRNGYISLRDGPRLGVAKLLKAALAATPLRQIVEQSVLLAERRGAPDRLLSRMYRLLIGIYIFRGWRQGLRALAVARSSGDGSS